MSLEICQHVYNTHAILIYIYIHVSLLVNIIYLQLLGIGLIIPGILLLIDNDIINDKILPLFQQVSLGSSNFGDLAKSLPIALICLGSCVLIISVIGLLGACCCKIRCFLMVVSCYVIMQHLDAQLSAHDAMPE